MHHLLEVIFPYIVLFYVFDCFVLIKTHQAALSSHFGRAYSLKKSGFRFLGISPLSRLFVTSTLPLFVSSKGMYIWKKTGWQDSDLYVPDAFEFIPFDTLEGIETEGSLLKINRRFTVDLQLPLFAVQIANTLRTLSELPAKHRWGRIEKWVGSRFDLTEIKNMYRRSSKYFSLLGTLAVFLFSATFILLPTLLYFHLPIHLPLFLIWMLFMYAMLLAIAGAYVTKGRTGTDGGLRLIISFIFSPATVVHPVHHFTKHLFYAFDLLAISAVFVHPSELGELLKKELKRVHFSIQHGVSDDLMRSLQIRETYLTKLLAIAGMAPDQVLMPPDPSDDRAHSYCPLCETEFLHGVDSCPDCRIPLAPYDKAPTPFRERGLPADSGNEPEASDGDPPLIRECGA